MSIDSRILEWTKKYEDWYGGRLDRKPIGSEKMINQPAGLLESIKESALLAHGWKHTETVRVVRPGMSVTLKKYHKVGTSAGADAESPERS